jgi:hypothetical protein
MWQLTVPLVQHRQSRMAQHEQPWTRLAAHDAAKGFNLIGVGQKGRRPFRGSRPQLFRADRCLRSPAQKADQTRRRLNCWLFCAKVPIICAASTLLALANSGAAQAAVASDNANDPAYAPQPNPSWSSVNGGTGYGAWTPLGGIHGGGTYMEGAGVNNSQVEGNYSFALYAGNGSYAARRFFRLAPP